MYHQCQYICSKTANPILLGWIEVQNCTVHGLHSNLKHGSRSWMGTVTTIPWSLASICQLNCVKVVRRGTPLHKTMLTHQNPTINPPPPASKWHPRWSVTDTTVQSRQQPNQVWAIFSSTRLTPPLSWTRWVFPAVYPWAVSCSLDFSLPSSFQLSLMVLIDYQTRPGI